MVEKILATGRAVTKSIPRFGEVIEIQGANGAGARWYAESRKFIGLCPSARAHPLTAPLRGAGRGRLGGDGTLDGGRGRRDFVAMAGEREIGSVVRT